MDRRSKSVCILLESYYPAIGGMETKGKILADELIKLGFKVLVLTRKLEKKSLSEEEISGARIFRTSPAGKGDFKRWVLIFTSFFLLCKHRAEYDTIYVIGFRTIGVAAIWIGSLFNKRVILEAASNGEFSGEFFRGGLRKLGMDINSFPIKIFLSVRSYFLRKADIFPAISEQIKQELINGNVSKEKIRYLPNFVSLDSFKPVAGNEKEIYRVKNNLPAEEKILIYTGRIVSYKGLPLLLRVFKEINEMNKDVLLVLVGEGGSDIFNCEKELKDFVKINKLEKKVFFTGRKNNIHEYLKASDIFVFPTVNEAFGISLIEAMACGLPVISTSEGEIDYYLVDRVNGIKIKPNDYHSLKEALVELLYNKKLCNNIGRAAVKTIQENYCNTVIMKKIVEII